MPKTNKNATIQYYINGEHWTTGQVQLPSELKLFVLPSKNSGVFIPLDFHFSSFFLLWNNVDSIRVCLCFGNDIAFDSSIENTQRIISSVSF